MQDSTTTSARPTPAHSLDAEAGGEPPILLVDDSRAAQHLASRLIQAGTGRTVVCANNGSQGLALVDQVRPALVVTDLQMPEMDGIELVKAIRVAHPQVPVVLMTAYGSEASAMQALAAGAANYVPKKNIITDLVATIQPLLALAAGNRLRYRLLSYQSSLARSFVLDNDAQLLSPLIDLIREDFDSFALGDETAGIRLAVAVRESLANALYHGNLECSTDLRQDDERVFYDLADERRKAEPYRSRRILVSSTIDHGEARIVIRDDGPGFDTSTLDKPFDPEDLMRVGGRGMILIRTFLDEYIHNATGNEITLIKKKQPQVRSTCKSRKDHI